MSQASSDEGSTRCLFGGETIRAAYLITQLEILSPLKRAIMNLQSLMTASRILPLAMNKQEIGKSILVFPSVLTETRDAIDLDLYFGQLHSHRGASGRLLGEELSVYRVHSLEIL
jgi:hypothetical protein